MTEYDKIVNGELEHIVENDPLIIKYQVIVSTIKGITIEIGFVYKGTGYTYKYDTVNGKSIDVNRKLEAISGKADLCTLDNEIFAEMINAISDYFVGKDMYDVYDLLDNA